MNGNLWGFLGIQRVTLTKTDEKVNHMIKNIFDTLSNLLDINISKYKDIHQLINDKRVLNDSQSYFWDWLNEKGYPYLQEILKINFPNDETLLELLDYRQMVLELDLETQMIDNYFTSIADTLESIKEYSISISD